MQTLGATGSLGHHASSIYQVNGVKGLYRAVIPTTLRAGILTASQLGVYDHAKFTFVPTFRLNPNGIDAFSVAGCCMTSPLSSRRDLEPISSRVG